MITQPIQNWSDAIFAALTNALNGFITAIPLIVGAIVIIVIGWLISNLAREARPGAARARRSRPGLRGARRRGLRRPVEAVQAERCRRRDRQVDHPLRLPRGRRERPRHAAGQPPAEPGAALDPEPARRGDHPARRAADRAVPARPDRGRRRQHGLHERGAPRANRGGRVVAFAVLIAIDQLGIAADLLNILFTGVVAALALAFGLAFGLGGRDVASRITESWYAGSQAAAERVRQAAEEGESAAKSGSSAASSGSTTTRRKRRSGRRPGAPEPLRSLRAAAAVSGPPEGLRRPRRPGRSQKDERGQQRHKCQHEPARRPSRRRGSELRRRPDHRLVRQRMRGLSSSTVLVTIHDVTCCAAWRCPLCVSAGGPTRQGAASEGRPSRRNVCGPRDSIDEVRRGIRRVEARQPRHWCVIGGSHRPVEGRDRGIARPRGAEQGPAYDRGHFPRRLRGPFRRGPT